MDSSSSSAAATAPSAQPSAKTASDPSAAEGDTPTAAPQSDAQAKSQAPDSSTIATDSDGKPLSKNQLKKRRRWEKAAAIKKRKKDQDREVRHAKALMDGRNLEAEREQQIQNQKEGKGWAKREEKWKQRMLDSKIEESFRVCLDCAFEEHMTWKETNSLSLQLRYAYAVNRRSSMPVIIDVCGIKKGCQTRAGLEKVEGFPERWVGRAFYCYEERLEEVYGGSIGENLNQSEAEGKSEEVVKNEDTTTDSAANDGNSKVSAESCSKDDNDSTNNCSEKQPYPKLRPNHKFVYLTGDSPNTLSTLDNNTTYIIGGIVDRNRLKRAAIDRAQSIDQSSLNITTARLPLDENCDFKGSTRILTCNHVFEILQKYRENGYKDWRKAIMEVLPCRKDVDEKEDGNDDDKQAEDQGNEVGDSEAGKES